MSTLFSTALFLIYVYFLGFVAAIPVGASQFEIARRSLGGFIASALFVVAGSVSSDFVYGSIALYGLAPFLQKPEVEAIFWLVNAALILVFAIAALRESKLNAAGGKFSIMPKQGEETEAQAQPRSRLANSRLGYITGFSLAFTNPLMIAWWLLAARFLKDLGVAVPLTSTIRIFFLIAGCLGIASYLSTFAIVIYRRHKSFAPKHIRRVTQGFGYVMILLALYFVVRSVAMLISPGNSSSGLLGTLFERILENHSLAGLYLKSICLVS